MQNTGQRTSSILFLNPAHYPGGIAMWGALKPVFDTTRIPPETGVHVHARRTVGGPKSIDETFDVVKVPHTLPNGTEGVFEINGDDAAHYNIAAIFGLPMTYLHCPECGTLHSERGFHTVHPHCIHKCACGCSFESANPCISNAVMLLKDLCGDTQQDRIVIDPVERKFINRQLREKGGNMVLVRLQIWGSNPAILWTSPKPEEGGIHVHMFLYEPRKATDPPTADETYGRVEIDGFNLDPQQIRHLMAQQALAYLAPHVLALSCPACGKEHFDRFEDAVTPHGYHFCEYCGIVFRSTELAVSNPVVAVIGRLRTLYDDLCEEPDCCYAG